MVGPGQFIADVGSIHVNKIFRSIAYVPKINTKRDMRCCELTYVAAEGGYRLRAKLAMMAASKKVTCFEKCLGNQNNPTLLNLK